MSLLSVLYFSSKDVTAEDEEPLELSAKEKYMEYQSAALYCKPKISLSIIGKLFSGVTRRFKIALFGSGLEVPGSKRIAQSILNPLPGSMFTSNGFYSGQSLILCHTSSYSAVYFIVLSIGLKPQKMLKSAKSQN